MLPALAPLFADSLSYQHPPTGWTDKEVLLYILGAIGSTLVLMVPIAWSVVLMLSSRARRRAASLEDENRTLRDSAGRDGGATEDLHQKLEQATKRVAQLEQKVSQVGEQAAGFEMAAKGLEGERDGLKAELEEAREEVAAEQRRVRKAVQKDGVTWTEKVLSTAPDFKPLDPDVRRTPVISVLNLKGGVGKTTCTANLGAALARRGWRVLLVDLDLQGSLTSLFLSDGRQEELHAGRRLLGDFLDASFDAEFPNILDYATPVLPGTKSMLVPTTDAMAYAETNLTLRWFLKESKRDPRFLLRKELQLRRVTDRFDVVLLDCPPFINVSCVNALAASDYVLVPVLPSKQATDRVTILMQRLKEFHDNLNTDLKVMGFFANRTKESKLNDGERNRLTALRDKCKDKWAAAPCFEAFIRQSADIRESEDERRPLGPGDDLYPSFVRLAEEVEDRLPMFCRPAGRVAEQEAADVTVEELRDTLTRLVELLRATDARAGTVKGLTEFVELTAGFGELNLKAFVKLAEAGRTPPAPKVPPAAKVSVDPTEVLRDVTGLYERAADPAVTESQIRAACERLASLKKDAVVKVAEGVGLQGMKSKKLADIVAAITNRLLDRKGAAIRSQLIDRPSAPEDVPSTSP